MAIHLSHQSLGDIQSVSREFATALHTNTNVKCILGVNDPESADFFAKHFGTRKAEKKTERAEKRGFGDFERTGHMSVRDVAEYKIDPNNLRTYSCGMGAISMIVRGQVIAEETRFYILSGILRCCDCGHPLVGQAAHGENSVHRYYGHTRAGSKLDCKHKRIPAGEVEAAVLEYLWNGTRQAGCLSQIEENIKAMGNVHSIDLAREKRGLKDSINSVKVQRDNLLKMQSRSTDEEALEDMAKMFEAKTKELAGLERQLKVLEDKPELPELVSESRQEIEERLREFERGFKKANGAMNRRKGLRVSKLQQLPSASARCL